MWFGRLRAFTRGRSFHHAMNEIDVFPEKGNTARLARESSLDWLSTSQVSAPPPACPMRPVRDRCTPHGIFHRCCKPTLTMCLVPSASKVP